MTAHLHPAIALVAILAAYCIAGSIDYEVERTAEAARTQPAPSVIAEARP